MKTQDGLQVIFYILTLVALTPILGSFMAKVFQGENHILLKPFGWLEKLTYKVCGITPSEEMSAKTYLFSVLIFNALGLVFVYLLQVTQHLLPLNSENLPPVSWHLALNTAMSFVTNTNWQSYAGEVTMSVLTQMLALCVQNFLSAATGIAVLLALIRGIVRKESKTLGNFWQDMTRSTVYVLLPLSLLLAVVLVGQGVVQNFSHSVVLTTLEGTQQTLPMGPAASQIAIKQLGTNGGGFFNVNSAHPFENPTPFSNFLQMLSLLLIPAALVYTYGVMTKSKKHAWVLFLVMLTVFVCGLGVSLYSEFQPVATLDNALPMEGKEVRFGIVNSVIWSTATTAASNGSVNAMHSSLTPFSAAVALFNIMLGEIIFGGVGSGLYGMLMFVLLTVFLCGLMVGRTPEYMGKKIETREIALVMVAVLTPSAAILLCSGFAAVLPMGLSSLANKGPHGLTEILYAFASASQNNGSAFSGLNANVPFYNVALSVCMLIGRYAVIIPTLLIAGHLAQKKSATTSEGTFSTDGFLFYGLLLAIILIVGALTFFPALALGPIVEQFLMQQNRVF